MVWQILVGTPKWVWFVLAFIIYRASKALHERPLSVPMLVGMPLFFVLLGLSGLFARFQAEPLMLAAWLLPLFIAVWAGTLTVSTHSVLGTRQAPRLAGSALPLVLMVVFFSVRYTLGVVQAMHAAWLAGVGAGIATSMLYGALSGFMWGRTLRTLLLVMRLPQAPLAMARDSEVAAAG